VKLTYATVIDGVFEWYVFEGSTGEILYKSPCPPLIKEEINRLILELEKI